MCFLVFGLAGFLIRPIFQRTLFDRFLFPVSVFDRFLFWSLSLASPFCSVLILRIYGCAFLFLAWLAFWSGQFFREPFLIAFCFLFPFWMAFCFLRVHFHCFLAFFGQPILQCTYSLDLWMCFFVFSLASFLIWWFFRRTLFDGGTC